MFIDWRLSSCNTEKACITLISLEVELFIQAFVIRLEKDTIKNRTPFLVAFLAER
jgi:hypothetical protein